MEWARLIAAVAAALGGLWIAFGDDRARKGSKVVAALIAVAAVVSLFDDFRASRAREGFERDLRVRTEETFKQVTGGDGVATIALSNLSVEGSTSWLVVNNPNDYPLYDLSFAIVDLERQAQMRLSGTSTEDSLFGSLLTVGPLSLGPRQTQLVRKLDVKSTPRISFAANATARNGAWFQALRYRRLPSGWVKASRVSKDGRTIDEVVDDGYPRGSSGEPEW
jgi:hypothetical protein